MAGSVEAKEVVSLGQIEGNVQALSDAVYHLEVFFRELCHGPMPMAEAKAEERAFMDRFEFIEDGIASLTKRIDKVNRELAKRGRLE